MGSPDYDRDPGQQPEPFIRPEQALAAAVIRQALLDARSGPWAPPARVRDAQRFLAGEDGALDLWLVVLGLPPPTRAGVRERLARLVRMTQAGRERGQGASVHPPARPAA
jgi:hypothetical protein